MNKNPLLRLVALCTLLAVTATALAGSVEIRLKDGATWRGAVNDTVEITVLEQGVEVPLTGTLIKAANLYLIVEAKIAGEVRQKTIFRDDIVKMRTVSGDAVEKPRTVQRRPKRPMKTRDAASDDVPRTADGRELGVFLLPMEGMVGESFRHDEIDKIGEIADEHGPGQIIVLLINSNGGLVLESEHITESIWDLKERHRVVAWVKKAISAGCATAMVCDEIYFQSHGTAGSVTTISGLSHIPEEQAQPGIDYLVEIARRSGYSEHIARSMKLKKYMCSYDKDEETGEITWYGDMSGEHILSSDEQNLTFNASNALKCGFSKGTADTEDDLAELLDLPRWHEISNEGRKMAKDWQDTVKRCKEEVPLLIQQRDYKNTSSGDPIVRLGTLIQINNKLIRWIDRCEWPCRLMGLPEKEYFERENEELRKQIADIRRRG
jgi:hypothetical protein